MANELVAGVSAIEEQNRSWRNEGQELPSLFPLGAMMAHDASCYGKMAKDIIGGRYQTLRIVASALKLKPALRVEFLSDLRGCGQIVFGSIKGNDPHSMPTMGGITREKAVGQINGLRQEISKDRPGNLLSGLGEGASVHGLGIGPQSSANGIMEKIARLDVNPLAFSARSHGENEGNELGERKLAIAGKILWQPLVMVGNVFRDKVQKRWDDIGELA